MLDIMRARGSAPASVKSARSPLLDDKSHRSGVVSHSVVTSHDGDKLWRLAEQLQRRKMHCVERADWFNRKRAADPSEHRSIDIEDEAALLEGPQRANGGLLLLRAQPARCSRPDDRPACFCEGQG